MPLEPIHRAALDGDLAAPNQLLQEDGGRLNAQMQQWIDVDGLRIRGCTPLMLASWRGHDAVVARLLALGADVTAKDSYNFQAAHWTCMGNHASTLALLLDAGASINDHDGAGFWTPLVKAATSPRRHRLRGAAHCPRRRRPRSRCNDRRGWVALHQAACGDKADARAVQHLLSAGADPTIRNDHGHTPLDLARQQACIVLLEAALIGAHCARTLLKARTILDAAFANRQARAGNMENEHEGGTVRRSTRLAPKQNAIAAAPPYLKRRVQQNQELPRVEVNEHADEQLVACVKYVLGLEGGGGVVFEGQAPQGGMVKEVFVELCEMLVPTYARKDM